MTPSLEIYTRQSTASASTSSCSICNYRSEHLITNPRSRYRSLVPGLLKTRLS